MCVCPIIGVAPYVVFCSLSSVVLRCGAMNCFTFMSLSLVTFAAAEDPDVACGHRQVDDGSSTEPLLQQLQAFHRFGTIQRTSAARKLASWEVP